MEDVLAIPSTTDAPLCNDAVKVVGWGLLPLNWHFEYLK